MNAEEKNMYEDMEREEPDALVLNHHRLDESHNDSVRMEDICLSPIRNSSFHEEITNIEVS
jgi:hypothetical protein